MNQESESNPSLNEFKFNVRRPKDCATKFPKDDNKDLVKYNLYFINFHHTHTIKTQFQYKKCVQRNIFNHPSYMSYSNFLQPTRRVRMTTQKILGNILKARKGAHMDKIIFKSKSSDHGSEIHESWTVTQSIFQSQKMRMAGKIV